MDILAPITKQGTHCIGLKHSKAHFEGSIIPQGATGMLQNSAGQRLTANLPRGVLEPSNAPCGIMEPSKCAPRSFGTMQRVSRFLMETYLVTGAKINTKIIKNLDFPNSFRVIFCKPLSFQRSIQPK